MGHKRLGNIPKTKKWTEVVEKITGAGGSGAGTGGRPPAPSVPVVAGEILIAAEGGFQEVKRDPGFNYTVYLLTQVVLSARQDDWQAGLDTLGVRLDPDATVFDLTAEVHRIVEEYRRKHPGSETVGEMAQQAA